MNSLYLFFSIVKHWFTAFRIKVFQKRFRTIKLFGSTPRLVKSEKLLAVVTHVVPNANTLSEKERAEKVERMVLTLEGLLDSLSSYELTIVVNTLPEMHLIDFLPTYLSEKVSLSFSAQKDPMMVEFDAFDIFKESSGDFQYYLFLEDDVILSDTWFVSKIKLFNEMAVDKKMVLLPHRYEMIEGNKFFIDQEIFYGDKMEAYSINALFSIKVGDVELQEFENSHAAIYLLDQTQLNIWLASGNKWKNQVVAFGALESAATYSLYENFTFLKPSLTNIDFLQVKHWGTKYSSRFYKK